MLIITTITTKVNTGATMWTTTTNTATSTKTTTGKCAILISPRLITTETTTEETMREKQSTLTLGESSSITRKDPIREATMMRQLTISTLILIIKPSQRSTTMITSMNISTMSQPFTKATSTTNVPTLSTNADTRDALTTTEVTLRPHLKSLSPQIQRLSSKITTDIHTTEAMTVMRKSCPLITQDTILRMSITQVTTQRAISLPNATPSAIMIPSSTKSTTSMLMSVRKVKEKNLARSQTKSWPNKKHRDKRNLPNKRERSRKPDLRRLDQSHHMLLRNGGLKALHLILNAQMTRRCLRLKSLLATDTSYLLMLLTRKRSLRRRQKSQRSHNKSQRSIISKRESLSRLIEDSPFHLCLRRLRRRQKRNQKSPKVN